MLFFEMQQKNWFCRWHTLTNAQNFVAHLWYTLSLISDREAETSVLFPGQKTLAETEMSGWFELAPLPCSVDSVS